MLTRRTTFRLYPNRTQEAKLFEARRLHAYLYNACIEHRKTSYRKFGKSVDYFIQQAAIVPFKECWPEYKSLNHGSLQATVKRVDFAYQRFFKGLGGIPRFQSLRRYSGWTYPDARQGFKVLSNGENGYLELRDLNIRIQMRGKARTWGNPTTCTIVYRHGKWYVSITVNCEPVRETGTGAVGLDFGVLTAIALSDGTKIENPRFLSKTLGKIRKASKAKRRKRKPDRKKKVKPSNRWKKANRRVSRLQRKIANQRKDWSHKVAAEIVSVNSLVATEKLEIQKMTRKAKKGKRKRQKTGLNRSILDVGIGMTRSAIQYKLLEAGGAFVEVPTLKVKPSQTCPACGHQEKKTLAERIHRCRKCNCTEDRDVASAKVCLNWARGMERASQSVERSSSTSCGSLKQLAAMKRQKLPPQQRGRE
jgi:transposase